MRNKISSKSFRGKLCSRFRQLEESEDILLPADENVSVKEGSLSETLATGQVLLIVNVNHSTKNRKNGCK